MVGVNSDRSVQELKGPTRPLQNELDRSEILLALKSVDFVTIFDEATPQSLIEILKPDILVKGGDWAIDQISGSKFVISQGGEVKSLSFFKGHSSTNIIAKLQS